MFNTLKFVIKILSNTALAHRSARAGDSNTRSISIKAVAEPGLYLQSDPGVQSPGMSVPRSDAADSSSDFN